MHMADALVSPAVGGAFWAAAAGLTAFSARKLQRDFDDRKVPLMAVLGAFIFSAQMINFSIPGTGSSGHLGGGMILAVLLGPYAGFITLFSVLLIQALFFADGGLLALGCNSFNLGFIPCFMACPLVYKTISGKQPGPRRLLAASVLSAVAALQLGALGVVLETVLSGVSEISFTTFVLLMQPIHLAIGIMEGLITFSVLAFVWKARPEILAIPADATPVVKYSFGVLVGVFAGAAVLVAGVVSWFASSHPDGLEWSLEKAAVTGSPSAEIRHAQQAAARIQDTTALFPDYAFRKTDPSETGADGHGSGVVDPAASAAGLAGALLTLAIIAIVAGLLRLWGQRRKNGQP